MSIKQWSWIIHCGYLRVIMGLFSLIVIITATCFITVKEAYVNCESSIYLILAKCDITIFFFIVYKHSQPAPLFFFVNDILCLWHHCQLSRRWCHHCIIKGNNLYRTEQRKQCTVQLLIYFNSLNTRVGEIYACTPCILK